MTSTITTTFTWHDINLTEVVLIDGIPYATRRAIGEWLEYADPQKAVDNLVERKPHIDAHSIPLNLRGMGGARNYQTEAYHPIGFLLIVMASGQPRAHEMQEAVAEFVWRFAGPRKLSFRETDTLMKRRLALLDRLAKTRDAFIQAALLEDLSELSLAAGVAMPSVELLGRDARQLKLAGV